MLSDTFLPVVDDRDWIHADLHVHTSHSKDCAVPVEAVLATAREVGLGALAIADHNTISGALEAAEMVGDGLIVIVAEEVMTQSGEVIGLFLREPIPKGLTFEEALSLIKEQGGLVYIPHPFDRLRTTPSYRLMVDNLHRIDVIETYNARNYLASFNLNAERFASKYNLAAGAGSDSHVLPGLGTAMLRMPRFQRAGRVHGRPARSRHSDQAQESALSAVAQAAADHPRPGDARQVTSRRARVRRSFPPTGQ